MKLGYLAAGVLLAGGVVGFYGYSPSTTPAGGTPGTATAVERQSRTASEDDSSTTVPEAAKQPLEGKLLAAEDLGVGWMPTGYTPDSTMLCPFKALGAYHNEGRAHAGFEDQSRNIVLTEVLTRYPAGDAAVVLSAVVDGVDGCASESGATGWVDDAGTWTGSASRRGDLVAVSMHNVAPDGTEITIEGRWQAVGDTVVNVMVASYGGPERDLADTTVRAAATRAA